MNRATIHGQVKSMNRLNIDKSGRNPKYLVYIDLETKKVESPEMDLSSNSLLMFQIKETDILKQVDRLPVIGNNLIITCVLDEDQLRRMLIETIAFADK